LEGRSSIQLKFSIIRHCLTWV